MILGSKCAVYDHEVEAAWFHRELALIGDADARGCPSSASALAPKRSVATLAAVSARAATAKSAGSTSTSKTAWSCRAVRGSSFTSTPASCPTSAELWATSPRAVQAFAIGPHVGVQFHPEIDDAQLKEWLASDEEETRELGLDVEALLDETAREPRQRAFARKQLVDLFVRRADDERRR